MNKKLIYKIFIPFAFLMLVCQVVWAGPPPAVGGTLPDFSVATPKDGDERSYLGLSFFSDSFKIPG